jgi:hypothetical protein
MSSWVEVNSSYYNKDAIDSIFVENIGTSAATEIYVVIHLRDGSDLQIGPCANTSAANAIVMAILSTDTIYGPYTN